MVQGKNVVPVYFLRGPSGQVDQLIIGANITPNFKDNIDTFGLSVATDGATKVDVHRNWIKSYERADGTGMRIAIEIGAEGAAHLSRRAQAQRVQAEPLALLRL